MMTDTITANAPHARFMLETSRQISDMENDFRDAIDLMRSLSVIAETVERDSAMTIHTISSIACKRVESLFEQWSTLRDAVASHRNARNGGAA